MPQISVIIPTYNHAHCLGRAVDSVLAQDFRDFEVLVVDAASTDATPEVMSGRVCGNVRYLRLLKRVNLPEGRNIGIQAGSGRYIALLDSDDAWQPAKLRLQWGLLSACGPEVAMVYTLLSVVSEQTGAEFFPPSTRLSGKVLEPLLENNLLLGAPSSALIRRDCLEAVGLFDPNVWSCEDWDLWLRLAQRYEIKLLPEPLTVRYEYAAGMSAQPGALRDGRALILEKHRKVYERYPARMAQSLYILGLQSLTLGERGAARRYFLRAFRAALFSAPLRALKSLVRAALG